MNKKKWTSLFLAFVMVLGILPLNVFANGNDGETGKPSANISISVDENSKKAHVDENGQITGRVTISEKKDMPNGAKIQVNGNEAVAIDNNSIQNLDFNVGFNESENEKDIIVSISGTGIKKTEKVNITRLVKLTFNSGENVISVTPNSADIEKGTNWNENLVSSVKFQDGYKLEGYYVGEKKLTSTDTFDKDTTITVKAEKGTTTPEPEKDEYTLYLNSRSSIKSVIGAEDTNSQKVKVGEKITIRAHRYYKDNDDNGEFDHWSVKGLSNYDDDSTREITFKMPKKDVTIEPIYDGENDDDDDDSKDIEIKRIEIYRNALVVQVNKKDARVYLKKKNSSYDDKKADEKESSNKYNAVFWENFYDKSDRENFKVYAKKGSDKTSEIKLDGSSSKIYRYDKDYDKDNKNDLKRIYPSNIELFDKSGSKYRKVKGKEKDYPNEKIYVYYDGSEYGNAKSDSDGYFEIKLDESLKSSDKSDLKFYVKDDSKKDTKAPIITRGITGELKLEGKGVANGATVEVKDSNGTKLGSTTADRDGKFTVSLNRALKGGEMLEVIAKESGKSDAITKFLVVGGVVGGPSVSNGYINGYPDGTFKPNNNMTRGEAAMMMARLINGSENFGTSKLTNFSDANYQWYSEAINFVVAKGLINGYPNGTFNPNGKITRAEFTQMISKYLTSTGTKQVNFNDVSGHWAQPAINKVASKGIIDGYSDGSFKPNKEITRAEASKILNGTFGITSTGSYTKYFTDVKKSDWFYNDVMNAANYK